MPDANWKRLERQAAKRLGGARVSRGDNFARSDTDVKIPGLPHLKIDCKYRKQIGVRSLYEEARKKYCKEPGDQMVLIVKERYQQSTLVVLDLDFFAWLLARAPDEDPKKSDKRS